jgi:hypothetical protein
VAVDILDHHLELGRRRHAALAPRLTFEHQSLYELAAGVTRRSHLTVCRHVITRSRMRRA